MTVKHTIHSLVFEIEGFQNNSHFQTIASRLSSIVRISLEPMLDRLFEEYSAEGYHIIIESLEIDLQFINTNNLTNDLTRLLRLELNKRFRKIHSQVTYDIKHGKASTKNYIQTKTDKLGIVLAKKQTTTAYQLNKNPSHYFNTISHQKVVPEDARYFDAVVHYLEYGWLPRYLDIPMLEFDEIFVNTLSTYGEEINTYFKHKSINIRSNITERIIRQSAKSKYLKRNKKASETFTKLILGDISYNQIQAFIKFLDHVNAGTLTYSKIQQDQLRKLIKKVSLNTELVRKITGINSSSFEKSSKIEELEARLNKIMDVNDKKFFNSLLETNFYKTLVKSYESKTDSHAVLVRTLIPSLLYPDQINEILKTAPELIDSENELINQLYGKSPLIINELFKNISSYSPSSSVLNHGIIEFISKLSKKQTNKILNSFFSYYSILSTQLNEINRYIEKTSYIDLFEYVSLSITGSKIKTTKKPSQSNKYAHIQLISLIANSKLTPKEVLSLYIKKTKEFLIKQRILKEQDEVDAFNIIMKIKERKFSSEQSEDRIVFQTLKQEQEILRKETKEVAIYSLKTLLQDFYLPTNLNLENLSNLIDEDISKLTTKDISKLTTKEISKLISKDISKLTTKDISKLINKDVSKLTSKDISKLINKDISKLTGKDISKLISKDISKLISKDKRVKKSILSKEEFKLKGGIDSLIKKLKSFKIPKKEIQEIFTNKRILKNPVLSKLKKETFKDILQLALSTDKARKYYKLYEKYKDVFRIHVNNEQVQLIFLSLISAHNELNEQSVFKLYYEELKKLKGWTYEVHKKNLINLYESKVERFTETEKELLIKYIDEIPTYTGLELRDTKKKLEEGIPVKNAGLCLLWPFFKTLFSISGYLDAKGEFKTVEMRERATLLLQYLAVKSTSIEEPYLALNKIFTGLPLEESIPKEIVLTEKEKDIADALLLNVIKQWPSFDNSSPDNLRGSFIIRDGVLFFRGKEWILRVENKAYDLLLSKLPWGYSMIRLSWVPYMIKVEWN